MNRTVTSFAMLCLPLLCDCSAQPSQAQSAPQPTAAVTVETAAAVPRALPRTITLTGTLIANRESAVAADTLGKVIAIEVERGSQVRAGATLARIDRRQALLELEQAGTQVATAESRASLAQVQCARAARLLEQGAINQAEYDKTSTQCRDASIGVDAAAIRHELARKQLGDLVIKAPFDGVIAERFVNPGEYVRSDTKIATLVQLDQLRLELSVPEDAISKFGSGAEVQFKVAAWPDQVFSGRVHYVGATVRRATRDLLVEALVPNPDQRLRPGMFAVADVVLGELVLPVVPASALRSDERAGNDRVFVMREGVLEERLVHAGSAADGVVPIRSGLRAGEFVVSNVTPNLRDGLRVQ